MKARQIDTGPGHQGGKPDDKIQRHRRSSLWRSLAFAVGVQRQVRELVVTREETLAFEKAAHTACDGVGQLAELGA